MSASYPVAGPMSMSRPDAQPLFGSASNSLSAGATGPAMRMLWQNTSTGDRSIWLMTGTNWDGSYVLLPRVPVAWSIAGSGDFNADGNADVVWQNSVTGDRSIWFMSGNTWGGTYVLLPRVSTDWSIAGVGDFNADGKPDIVWQNTTTGDRSIWFMNGSTWGGTYALLPRVTTDWSIAGVGDFNGDGKPDLVWQNTTTGQRSIWFMNGSTWDGTYSLLQTVPTDWRIAGVADFDGDGDPDLAWQNLNTGQRSVWLMNGSVWNGSYALLPTVPKQWSIAGVLVASVGPASKLVFTVQPGNATAGAAITPAVQVAVEDAQGNVVTTATTSITLAIGNNPGSGTLSGTTTVAAVNGLATFSGLSLNTSGAGYTLTASATGLTGAASSAFSISGGGGGGTVSYTFCSAYAPIWFAVQDGNGAWTQVLPNSGTTTYEFSLASGRGGIAYVYNVVVFTYTFTYLSVGYASSAEFTAGGLSTVNIGRVCGSRTVNGTVANVGASEQASVSLGQSQTGATPGAGTFPSYQLMNVGDGPQDLFAQRATSSGGTSAANKVVVRRGLSPADNSTIPLLDFDAEGFVPASANVTVTGLGSDSAVVSSLFATQVGSGLIQAGVVLGQILYGAASGAQPYVAIPSDQLNANDFQYVTVGTTGAGAGRSAAVYFRNPLDQTIALGPDLSTPTVTKLVTAPNARPRVQLASQTEYNREFGAVFVQSTRNGGVLVSATAGYYGGTPATWDVTVPDLSAAAGWNPAWGLQDGTPIDWAVAAQGGASPSLDLSFTDGSKLLFATKRSSTPLNLSAMRIGPGGSPWDRRLLDALRSRVGSPLRP
jgi:hypothetical protein